MPEADSPTPTTPQQRPATDPKPATDAANQPNTRRADPNAAERTLRAVGGIAGLLLFLITAAGTLLALLEGVSAAGSITVWWASLCLAVVATGAAFPAAFLLKRVRNGPAMTLFCAGGTGLIGAVLADTDLIFVAAQGGLPPNPTTIMGVNLYVIAAASFALAAILFTLSILVLLVRSSARTLPRVIAGAVMLAIPAAAALALFRIGFPTASTFGGGPIGAAVLAGLAATALIVAVLLLSAAVHLIVTALSIGIDIGEQRDATRTSNA